MPYLKISTNKPLNKDQEAEMSVKASALVSVLLSKPENYVMIEISSSNTMLFAGSNTPLAYVELKSIGLPGDQTAKFSSQLCDFISTHLSINADRVYIEFASAERHLWGWNKDTF